MVEPQKAGGAWERKRIRTSLEIECAALELLSRRGLDEVTVEQIAVAAGISTRTFFRYFRNVRDVLTGVPQRESERLCAALMDRPREEGLLDSLRAVYRESDAVAAAVTPAENFELEARAVGVWGQIVRSAPDTVLVESHATAVLAAGFEEVIRDRDQLESADSEDPGVAAAALAAVVWFVYLRWLEGGGIGSLSIPLNRAFAVLAEVLGSIDGSRHRAL